MHTGSCIDFSTLIHFDEDIGPRSSLYDGGRYSTTTLLMYHHIAHSMFRVDSSTRFRMYLSDGGHEGVTSFAPCRFNELLLHSSSENCKSSSVVPCPRGMKVLVVILSNVPGFSNVASFGLKSKSRLSYASVHRPFLDRFHMISHLSAVSDLTIFTTDGTETLQPPWASTFMTCSGVFTDSRKNPWTAWNALHQVFMLCARINSMAHPF